MCFTIIVLPSLLDVTPAAVDRLHFAQLYPIVIFLRADTKHAVKAIRSQMAKGSRKSSRKLFETSQKLDSVYGHIFTSSVSLAGEEPTAWYHKLREVRLLWFQILVDGKWSKLPVHS